MSRPTANWPPRIFSPVGEFQAWDTIFQQQVPRSMRDLLKSPNVPPMEKPKRPESFVIMDENGPAGMSTPSAGSQENLYKEYKLQSKVHHELKRWVRNTLSQDFRNTCCTKDQTAFQWRMNVVRRLREVLKESGGARIASQGVTDPQQQPPSDEDEDDEPPRKKRKAEHAACSEREAELERRVSSLTTEVRELRELMTNFQQKVTSLEDSGYVSGSANKQRTSPSAFESAGSSDESSSGSEESETEELNFTSSPPVVGRMSAQVAIRSSPMKGVDEDDYTSSPPIIGPPPVALPATSRSRHNAIPPVSNPRLRRATAPTASKIGARQVRNSAVPVPRPQQAPNLARVTGGFPIENEYTSSPPVLKRGHAVRSAVSNSPVAVPDSESETEADASGSESEGSESDSVDDGSESASDEESGSEMED